MSHKLRLFGGEDCFHCKFAVEFMKGLNINHEYIDAHDNAMQALCDEQDIDEVPHLQVIDEVGDVIEEYVGLCVLQYLQKLTRNSPNP